MERGPRFHILCNTESLGDHPPDTATELVLVPDWGSVFRDPFGKRPLAVFCHLIDPRTHAHYPHDPRTIAQRVERHLQETRIATGSMWGMEFQFFLGKRHGTEWAVPDSHRSRAVRTQIAETLERTGIEVVRHREVVPGLCAFTLRHKPLLAACDQLTIAKYAIARTCERTKLRVEFCPTVPWVRDTVARIHLHVSLWKGGRPLFYNQGTAGFSELATTFFNGVLERAPSLAAIVAPSLAAIVAPSLAADSLPGGPMMGIRAPHDLGDRKARRIAISAPDPSANPYLACPAILMAGLAGESDGTTVGYSDLHARLFPTDKPTDNRVFLREGNVFSEETLRALTQPATPKP
jgi:glutamine synthetase